MARYDQVSVYTLQIRQDDGGPLNLRMTHRVQDALFGPPILGTPQREQWERARQQKRISSRMASPAGGAPKHEGFVGIVFAYSNISEGN